MKRHIWKFLWLLLLAGSWSLAQQEEPPIIETTGSTEGETAGETIPEPATAEPATGSPEGGIPPEEVIPEPAPTAAEDSAADADTSPFDYRASEQISEDLSVSFPVDI